MTPETGDLLARADDPDRLAAALRAAESRVTAETEAKIEAAVEQFMERLASIIRATTERAERAEQERDDWCRRWDDARKRADEAKAALVEARLERNVAEAALAEERALVDRLAPYADHTNECPTRRAGKRRDCSCGVFDAVKDWRAARAAPGTDPT